MHVAVIISAELESTVDQKRMIEFHAAFHILFFVFFPPDAFAVAAPFCLRWSFIGSLDT